MEVAGSRWKYMEADLEVDRSRWKFPSTSPKKRKSVLRHRGGATAQKITMRMFFYPNHT